MAEKLYDVWARRNPNWEKRYEDSIIKISAIMGKVLPAWAMPKGSCLVLDMKSSSLRSLSVYITTKGENL